MTFDKEKVIEWYDQLSRILTDLEQGEDSIYDLYYFMVDTHLALANILN